MAVIELIFDDDQIPVLVDGQQIQPLASVIKAVELFLDNQQLVAVTLSQGLGVVLQPFLQVLALGEAEIAEAFNVQWVDAVGVWINFKQYTSGDPILSQALPLSG